MSAGLELRRLSVGYPRRPVFEGLDLECVAPGALVALVGPNAVGKSTLLKAIAGLRPARGQVLLDGRDGSGGVYQSTTLVTLTMRP